MRQDYLRTLQNNPDFTHLVIEDGIGNLHLAGENEKTNFISNLKVCFNTIINLIKDSKKVGPRTTYVDLETLARIEGNFAYYTYEGSMKRIENPADFKGLGR